MPNKSLSINIPAAEAQLKVIEEDIQTIADLFKEINGKMLQLDESVWFGPEKNKIDEQYMPYLKKLDEQTSSYLMNFVNTIRQSIIENQEVEEQIKTAADELLDI